MATIISLSDLRSYLRMPTTFTMDDAILTNILIPAVGDVIDRETGINVPKQYDEYYDGGDANIYLRNIPLLSVQLVEEGWGWINYTLDQVEVNSQPAGSMFAYSIDSQESAQISRRSAGNVLVPFVNGSSNIHVTYTAGRQNIPETIYLAALDLCAHWYQNSLQRSMGTGTAAGYDYVNQDFPRSGSDIYTSINQGVPYRILEMLKPYRREPFIG